MKLKLTNIGVQELGQKLEPTQLALGQPRGFGAQGPTELTEKYAWQNLHTLLQKIFTESFSQNPPTASTLYFRYP